MRDSKRDTDIKNRLWTLGEGEGGMIWENSIETCIRSDQISRSVVSDSLRPHELQHARPPCPSPTPGVHWDSRPSSQWSHNKTAPLEPLRALQMLSVNSPWIHYTMLSFQSCCGQPLNCWEPRGAAGYVLLQETSIALPSSCRKWWSGAPHSAWWICLPKVSRRCEKGTRTPPWSRSSGQPRLLWFAKRANTILCLC